MPVLPDFQPENASYGRTLQFEQSMMERAQNQQLAQERADQQKQEFQAKLPAVQAQVGADIASAKASVENAALMEQFRAKAASESKDLNDAYLQAIQIPNFEDQARALSALQPRVSYMDTLPEYKGFVTAVNNATVRAHSSALLDRKLQNGLSQDEQFFNHLQNGLTPEEQDRARRMKLGLEGRVSGAAIQYQIVEGQNGQKQLVAVDPRNVGAQVIGSGQTYGSGVGQTPESQAAASGQPPAGQNNFVSQTTYEKNQQAEQGKKDAEYTAKLRQEKPKREMALNQASALTEQMSQDIDGLIAKVTESTAGPGGVVLSYWPGSTAKDFKANLDSVKANIMFQTIQSIREASPTGGAFGNLSDKEGALTQARYGALEIGQSPKQLIENLKKVKQRILQNYAITRSAFANEYGGEPNEKSSDGAASQDSTPLKVLSVTPGG